MIMLYTINDRYFLSSDKNDLDTISDILSLYAKLRHQGFWNSNEDYNVILKSFVQDLTSLTHKGVLAITTESLIDQKLPKELNPFYSKLYPFTGLFLFYLDTMNVSIDINNKILNIFKFQSNSVTILPIKNFKELIDSLRHHCTDLDLVKKETKSFSLNEDSENKVVNNSSVVSEAESKIPKSPIIKTKGIKIVKNDIASVLKNLDHYTLDEKLDSEND